MTIREFAVKALDMKGKTISSSVISLTGGGGFGFSSADLLNADKAVITARTAGVMISWDGTDPTATLGHLVAQNTNYEITGNEKINALKFLREAATDAAVTVTLEQATFRY